MEHAAVPSTRRLGTGRRDTWSTQRDTWSTQRRRRIGAQHTGVASTMPEPDREIGESTQCAGCGRQVSLWAANCSFCGTALAHTPPLSPTDDTTERGPHKRSRRRSLRRRVLPPLCVAAALLVLALAFVLTRGRGGADHARLPLDLRNRLVFLADGHGHDTQLVRADGSVVADLADLRAVGYPQIPVVVGGDTVVFIHDSVAYALQTTGAHKVRMLGPAQSLFAVSADTVGVVSPPGATDSGALPVRYLTAQGRVVAPAGLPSAVPTDATVVGQVAPGLLAVRSADHLDFAGNGFLSDSATINYMIGAGPDVVAWTAPDGCAPDGFECPLRVTLLSGAGPGFDDSGFDPPAGFLGFVGGGAISPDGRTLAAFVYDRSTGHIQLAIVNLHTGSSEVLGPQLPSGEPVGSAVWTPDGNWLFFSGLGGSLYAQRFATAGPAGSAVMLSLPGSYSMAAL